MKIVYQEENEKNDPEESVLNPEKIHASDLSRKERRLLEKEKLAGMGIGKKLEYIWMYYKAVIFGVIFFIAAVFIGWDIYQNAQIKNILSVYVVNGGMMDTKPIQEQAMELFEANEKKESVIVNPNLATDKGGKEFDYTSQMLFVTQLQAETMDVMVMPESLYESLKKEKIFTNLAKFPDAEEFGEHLQGDHLHFDREELKDQIPLGYDSVCVAVLTNAENPENAVEWMKSLL